jgi:hypothetical protein
VQAARQQLATLGAPLPDSVVGIDRDLDELARTILGDPLAFDPSTLDEIARRLDDVAGELAEVAAVRADWADRLSSARDLLTEGVADGDLGAELDEIAALAERAEWHLVGPALVRWRRRAQRVLDAAGQIAASQQGLIDARNELRGRLDAYWAKAGALGRLEDADLAKLHARAQAVLYTAPTDLDVAAELVGQYQRELARAVTS